MYQYQEYRPFEHNFAAPLQEFRKELSRLDSKEIPEKRSSEVRKFLQLNIQRLEFMQKRVDMLGAVPKISDKDRELPELTTEPNSIILLIAAFLTIVTLINNYFSSSYQDNVITQTMTTIVIGLVVIYVIWLAIYYQSKDERKQAEEQLKRKIKQADEAHKYADNYGLGQVKAITEKLRRMKE